MINLTPNDSTHFMVTDLSFLKNFCSNNAIRIQKYIEMYLHSAPKNLQLIEKAIESKDYEKIHITLHQLKTQMLYLGMTESVKLADQMDESCRLKKNLSELPNQFLSLFKSCELSFGELT